MLVDGKPAIQLAILDRDIIEREAIINMILWTILCLTAGLAAEIADNILKKYLTTIPFPCAFAQGEVIISQEKHFVNSSLRQRVLNLQNIYKDEQFCNYQEF